MTTLQPRHELLGARSRSFTRSLHRLQTGKAGGDARVIDAAWVASRRVREILPVLQAHPEAVQKLSARLRKLSRRLADARDLVAVLQRLDDLVSSEQRGRHAAVRVRAEVQKLADRARADLVRKKTIHEIDRMSAKLDVLRQRLRAAPSTRVRDLRWAVSARVVRRAASLKDAIGAAGSVYLAERLQRVSAALTKLRFGAELGLAVASGVTAADLRTIVRLQALLGRLREMQLLIERIRQVQSGLATPDLKAWRDLDNLVTTLETRCRGLHARYVREREALVALCDGLVARAPARPDGARRKAS
jgi:hypothetical protein